MKAQPLTVFLPDTRGVNISRYGIGNMKIGMGVLTYSRPAGSAETCPGATAECESICYAKRIEGPVLNVYRANNAQDVPEIPKHLGNLLRIHVSGDFDSVAYIENWITRITEAPDMAVWAYTRSWRVAELLPALERLRALPNMQLFASMDASCSDLPPQGWRRAWILRTKPNGPWGIDPRLDLQRHSLDIGEGEVRMGEMFVTVNVDHTPGYVCPEETGRRANCVECGYCFEGQKHDVVFLEH